MPARRKRKKTYEERTKWFREAKLGMFIHWGVYSMIGRGEWVMHVEQIPVEEYEKLYPKFNPVKYNPKQWVALAKEAGCEYVNITTRHHDGFSMFDSEITEYDIMSTPYGKDVIAMLAKEVKQHGLKMCFYYSILDWHHPDYLPRRNWDTRPTEGADLKRYLKFMKGQLKELCTKYGKVACIWYDMGGEHTAEEWETKKQNAMIRRLQPDVLINDRGQIPEDFGTPEQRVPPTGITNEDGSPRLWEACMTITSHWWGYDKHEKKFKTHEQLLRTFVDIVSKGGNFLLNVGPKPDGTIQKEFVDAFQAIGKWMSVNSEAIYGTTASPFRRLPFFGRCTAKGKRLYLHVFEWPRDRVLKLQGLKTKVKAARLLAAPDKELAVTADDGEVRIEVPAKAPDKIVSVVEVDLAGTPEVEQIVLGPDEKDNVALPALYAEIHGPHGQRAQPETSDGIVHVGNWINPRDKAAWDFDLPKGGEYDVTLTYACPKTHSGSAIEVRVGVEDPPEGKKDKAPKVAGKVRATKSWGDFRKMKVGSIRLKKGANVIAVRCTDMPKGAVMSLRQVDVRAVKKK